MTQLQSLEFSTQPYFTTDYIWIFKQNKDFSLHKLKKNFSKIADATSSFFSGIRSVCDLIDPKKNFFSRKTSLLLTLTTGADFLKSPYNAEDMLSDVLSFFSVKTIAERVNILFSFIEDTRDLIQDGATLCTLLHTFNFVTEKTIFWTEKFSFLSFGVDFISTAKLSFSCKRVFTTFKTLTHDRDLLNSKKKITETKKTALKILQKIEADKETLAKDLYISKKILQKKIDSLSKDILSKSKKKSAAAFKETKKFLEVLTRRANMQTGCAIIDLVISVISSIGIFIGFFPPLSLPSTCILAAKGTVSFLLWGGKSLALKKNPFE